MTTATAALMENLESVKRLARSFTRFGYEPSDLEQEACLIFLRHWEKKPDTMPVSNFIRQRVYYGLIDYTTRGQRRKCHQLLFEEVLVTREDTELLSDMLLSLKEDSQLILETIYDAPIELRSIFRNKCALKEPLISYFRKSMGWTKSRTREAIKQLEILCTS